MPKGSKPAATNKPSGGGVAKYLQTKPRNFGIGGDIQPKRDLTRFVRWPKYIKVQRQKRVLNKRLKVPPVIAQFNNTLDKNVAQTLFTFLEKYSPESKQEKKARLLSQATGETEVATSKVNVVKYGLNHVTTLVEQKKAKLVIIAHDVDPIELVMWLPTLCRKKGVPYMIVKGKARLGQVVNKKTAAALAIVDVDTKDKKDLTDLITRADDAFANRYTYTMKQQGGGIMGYKHLSKKALKARILAKETNRK
eukprot:TRINITY_DN7887_c0_g1_i1.p2 TRINITY_DN7887_c0_g1~~TRINITY_DN7887_c0_g1_i1.p2  ORF type:complete len:251 (+),score=91.55 TRINITY_DN7887_c0_g1_i1:50-802(+)